MGTNFCEIGNEIPNVPSMKKALEEAICKMVAILSRHLCVNTLRPRQNARHFADDTFKHIFFNENFRISIKISLKFVPKGPINNIPTLVLIMAWRRSGDKPLSEPMMVSLMTQLCVTRPQWVTTYIMSVCGMWTAPTWHHDFIKVTSLTRVGLYHMRSFNTLWPSGTIWRHRSWSTSAKVMACCHSLPKLMLTYHRCSVGTFTRSAREVNR